MLRALYRITCIIKHNPTIPWHFDVGVVFSHPKRAYKTARSKKPAIRTKRPIENSLSFFYTMSMRGLIRKCFITVGLLGALYFSAYAQKGGGVMRAAASFASKKAPVAAQQTFRMGTRTIKPNTWKGKNLVSRVLRYRVERSYKKARQYIFSGAQPILSPNTHQNFGLSRRMHHDLLVEPQEIYPDKTFLSNYSQLTRYFLAENNRKILKEYKNFEELHRQILQALPEFERQIASPAHPIEQDMIWLAKELPDELNYLLIGEYHSFPQIQQSIAPFLRQVRQRFPERKIILLTEFLEEGTQWEPSMPSFLPPTYSLVWREAAHQDISILGLEPSFVHDPFANPNLSVLTGQNFLGMPIESYQNLYPWMTLEGISIRNNRFLQTIEHVRQQNPDALLIVFAGAWHTEENHPYSLGKLLRDLGNVFTITFCPEEFETPFDQLTKKNFLDVRILNLTDPKLRQLAGFHVQIRIPETPVEYLTGATNP